MFGKTNLTIATATIVTIVTVGLNSTNTFAGEVSAQDQERPVLLAKVSSYEKQGSRIRVINPRCNKYLIKFQRTGNEYYMRLFRRCTRQPL